MKDQINILKLIGIIFTSLMLVILLDFALKAALEAWTNSL
ncbi:hypothetical protein DET49_12323 [Salegentibacter sp. 24]|jgi:hypothetical protein|nr:hypothetical protein DET49_12323 [Salegentibacter sp. 24]